MHAPRWHRGAGKGVQLEHRSTRDRLLGTVDVNLVDCSDEPRA